MCMINSQFIRWLVWAGNCLSSRRFADHSSERWQMVAAESYVGRAADCSGFYWKVSRCLRQLLNKVRQVWQAESAVLAVTKEGIDSLDVCCSDEPAPCHWHIGQCRDYNVAEDFLQSDITQSVMLQYSQSIQRLCTLTDDAADVVWCWQVVAKCKSRVRPIPQFTDTSNTDTFGLLRYRVPIPILGVIWRQQ